MNFSIGNIQNDCPQKNQYLCDCATEMEGLLMQALIQTEMCWEEF